MPIYDIEVYDTYDPAPHSCEKECPNPATVPCFASPEGQRPYPCIGPRYTAEEERDIQTAIAGSIAYMESYGRGSAPAPVDKSRYIQPLEPQLQ